jgi:hypothetical protein
MRRNADYFFIDGVVQEYFEIGGVSVFLHKYLGVYDQGNTGDFSQPGAATSPYKGVQQIQDLFFKENRDRHYDKSVYELKGMYNIQDIEYNNQQFGMFLDNDTIFIEFHLNECLEKIGRKLLSGDVLEMFHMRDDALLNDLSPATNKFYVIDDVSRSESGWSATWRPHVIRCKIKPMTNSQEFSDITSLPASSQVGGADGILGNGLTLADILSDQTALTTINQADDAQAFQNVPYRGYTMEQFWVSERGICHLPWLHFGIGAPPNGAKLAGRGPELPKAACEGDWFLLTKEAECKNAVLYQHSGDSWHAREMDWRLKWEAANRILESFINNKKITTFEDGSKTPERVAISKVIKPRADF